MLDPMHKWKNVAFHIQVQSSWYLKKHECDTNETLDYTNEMKIKNDQLSIFGTNEDEYAIATGVVCLTLTGRKPKVEW